MENATIPNILKRKISYTQIEFPQIETYGDDCVGANQKIFKNIPD